MARIILEQRGQVIKDFSLQRGSLTVGRRNDNTVVLNDPQVSGYHARIDKRGSDYIITDLQSTNGTLVNTRRVLSHRLSHGDRIAIGKHALLFIGTEKAKAEAELEKIPLDKTVILGSQRRSPELPATGAVAPPIPKPTGSGLLRRLLLLFFLVAAIVGVGLWNFRDRVPLIPEMPPPPSLVIEKIPPDEPLILQNREPLPGGEGDSRFAIEAIVWSSDGSGSFALINGLKLMVGDGIEGMTVKDIGRDYVVLQSEDGRSTVRLTLTLK